MSAPHDTPGSHDRDSVPPGGHSPFLQHHFDTEQQQFDSGKLGIWLFLVTEVLFFSGLFCAYSLWRAQHPEIFDFAHKYLDTKWGAINTLVLLFSSLTAAWAVRSAQLGNKKGLIINIVLTLVCAFGFMGIKTVEYMSKIHHGTLFGKYFDPHEPPPHYVDPVTGVAWDEHEDAESEPDGELAAPGSGATNVAPADAVEPQGAVPASADLDQPAGEAIDDDIMAEGATGAAAYGFVAAKTEDGRIFHYPKNTHVFFSIYFCMTGLHGIHVMAGIFVWIWLLLRAMKGQFGPKYFGPIDYAALYWHIVDLVWIYLFPLLYLIH